MIWQIVLVLYAAGFMLSIVPITKVLSTAHAGKDYHGKQEKVEADDFWFGFLCTIFLASWIWPVLLIGLYFKKLVLEDK